MTLVNERPIKPEQVDELLDKLMGISEPEIKVATKKFCLDYIAEEEGHDEDDCITVGEMNQWGWAFVAGYEACLNARNR